MEQTCCRKKDCNFRAGGDKCGGETTIITATIAFAKCLLLLLQQQLLLLLLLLQRISRSQLISRPEHFATA
jgi:hypothetical protein